MRRAGAEVATALDGALDRAELTVERRGETILLLSPGVGLFTAARLEGDLLAAGADAGVLLALGRTIRLAVPTGVEGRVVAPRRAPGNEPVRRPVGWGDPLYELHPLEAEVGPGSRPSSRGAPSAGLEPAAEGGRLLLLAPQSGRFYLRPSPAEEPFVVPGAIVEEGQPIGLIEVMKTFAHLRYTGAGGLPPRARVARVLAEDGAEIAAGDPLLELEPVPPASTR